MLRKVIFTVLALALAWGLGNVLYEVWISGQIHAPATRGAPAADYAYSGDHAKFLLRFSLDAFGALCGVLLTLGLGWMKDRPDAKNSDQLHKQGVTDK
jgi:hypothetical protein